MLKKNLKKSFQKRFQEIFQKNYWNKKFHIFLQNSPVSDSLVLIFEPNLNLLAKLPSLGQVWIFGQNFDFFFEILLVGRSLDFRRNF